MQTHGRAGAEELVGLVAAIFEELIGTCDRFGGDVLKFRGDAGEDEERFLRALRSVVDGYDGPLVLRAGVNRGSAFCGDVGTATRRTSR